MNTQQHRAYSVALATVLLASSPLPAAADEAPSATADESPPAPASESPAPAADDSATIAAGIGLMIIGTGALAGAAFYAVGRRGMEEDDPSPSGGTLAAIGGIGLAGLAVGIGITVATLSGHDAPDGKPTARARLYFAPSGAVLSITF